MSDLRKDAAFSMELASARRRGLEEVLGTDAKVERPVKRSHRFPVECLECGRKFSTSSMLPSCPRCGGSDIDVR